MGSTLAENRGQSQGGDTSTERREERVADVSPAPPTWYSPRFPHVHLYPLGVNRWFDNHAREF